MKAWLYVCVFLGCTSLALAQNENTDPVSIYVGASGSLTSFKLGHSPEQAKDESTPAIILHPGESYKGLLYVFTTKKGEAKFVDKAGKNYFVRPHTAATEIHNIDPLSSAVPAPLAGDYDPETNIDPILSDVMKEFHILKDKSGQLVLDAPALKNNCKLSDISEIRPALNIPSTVFLNDLEVHQNLYVYDQLSKFISSYVKKNIHSYRNI